MTRPSWNEYFMTIAKVVSTRSTCNSRPTGAVIVRDKQILSTGYNGSAPGVTHCSDSGPDYCYRRQTGVGDEDKYNYCKSIHGEMNAVVRAAKLGISLEGADCFCTLAPCYVCLKSLAGAGIKRVVYEYDYESQNKDRDLYWKNSVKESSIEIVEQLIVSQEAIEMVLKALIIPTSKRRLR